VILGSNFVKCPTLKAKIGTSEVPANFHEAGKKKKEKFLRKFVFDISLCSGTLWVIVPPLPVGRYSVAASNDGIFWTKSPTMLEYVE
jgi:hypothetical protein